MIKPIIQPNTPIKDVATQVSNPTKIINPIIFKNVIISHSYHIPNFYQPNLILLDKML